MELKNNFYHIKWEDYALAISGLEHFEKSPLIWENDGAYSLIGVTRMAAMIDLIADKVKTREPHTLPILVAVFYWSDCVPLDPKVAKILLGADE